MSVWTMTHYPMAFFRLFEICRDEKFSEFILNYCGFEIGSNALGIYIEAVCLKNLFVVYVSLTVCLIEKKRFSCF